MTYTMPKFLDRMPTFTAPKFTTPTMDDAKSCWTYGNWILVTVWMIAGILTIYIPHKKWLNARDDYYTSTGYAIEAEYQQRAYEEAQQDQNNEGYYNSSADCKWYQWACRKAAYLYRQQNENANEQNGNNNAEDVSTIPLWYIFLGGQTEEDRRDREESGQNTDTTNALDIMYNWTIIMFVVVLLYGAYTLFRLRQNGAMYLLVTLGLLFQFSLMSMILLAQGVIQTDNREMEDSVYGWYGQKSVLLLLTNYAITLFSGIYIIIVLITNVAVWITTRTRNNQKRNEDMKIADEETNSYVAIEAPKIEITDKE
jgi:hypothetical protein